MNVLAKVIVNGVTTAVSMSGRALVQAVKEARAGHVQGAVKKQAAVRVSRRVPIAEARHILGFDEEVAAAEGYSSDAPNPLGDLTKEDVQAKFEKLFAANGEEKGNSFYLQSKVYRSHEALMHEFAKLEPEEEEAAEEEEGKEQAEGTEGVEGAGVEGADQPKKEGEATEAEASTAAASESESGASAGASAGASSDSDSGKDTAGEKARPEK